MRNPMVWLVLWAGTLAGAWYLGSEGTFGGGAGGRTGEDALPVDEQVSTLKGQVSSLKAQLAARGPSLHGSGGSAGSSLAGENPAARTKAEETKFVPVYEFKLDGIKTAEEAVKHFIAYGKTMLSMGREGHLKLYEQMDAWTQDREMGQRMENLFGRGERAARYMVPLIREALDHSEELADMNETLLEQMVEKPEYFSDKDDDPLEFFTEGLGMVLPAVVSEKRLEKWSGYVRSILAQDKETQPEAIQKNRRDLERLLRIWMPEMTPEQIYKMLEGGVAPEEAMGLLEQLPAGSLERVDVGQYLAPLVAKGDWRAIRMLGKFSLSASAISTLDTSVVQAIGAGSMQPWALSQYLKSTQRRDWSSASGMIERGMRDTNAKVRDAFARAAMQMQPGPDANWARTAVSSFELSDSMIQQMKRKWKIQ